MFCLLLFCRFKSIKKVVEVSQHVVHVLFQEMSELQDTIKSKKNAMSMCTKFTEYRLRRHCSPNSYALLSLTSLHLVDSYVLYVTDYITHVSTTCKTSEMGLNGIPKTILNFCRLTKIHSVLKGDNGAAKLYPTILWVCVRIRTGNRTLDFYIFFAN